MEGQQSIKRKAEASPERTDGIMASKSGKTTETNRMEGITTSIAKSALSRNAPNFNDGINSNTNTQVPTDSINDMGPESDVEEHKHTFGGSEVTFKLFIQDDDDEFDDWLYTIHVHCSFAGKEIGTALGRFVRRDRIRLNFLRDIDGPCLKISGIAFELFDRYGRLKREFVDHAVRKGSSSWGSEVDFGPLFIVEYVRMEPAWRRKGVGKKMVESLIAKASAEKKMPEPLKGNSSAEDKRVESNFNKNDPKANTLAFTLASPGWLQWDTTYSLVGNTTREKRDIQFAAQDISVAFFRSIGFRRIGASSCFGLAADPNHKANKIPAHDDFNLPDEGVDDEDLEARDTAKQKFFSEEREHSLLMELLKKRLPLHHAALTLPDYECAYHFEKINRLPNSEKEWKKVDKKLNNVLHIASCEYKFRTVAWLMSNVDLAQTLSSARNIKGYTALEALQSVLETKRTTMEHILSTACISDNFTGFPTAAVHCVAILQNIKSSSPLSGRLGFGCTCGQCHHGFFSPRMREALLYQAELLHDKLDEYNDNGPLWVEIHGHVTRHVAPRVQRDFTTNRSLRCGFANLFSHVKDTMSRGELPGVEPVLNAWKNSGEQPPVTRSYLEGGGTVRDALHAIFEAARDADRWAGNGRLPNNALGVDEAEEPTELAALPHCRNDLEFGMVALHFGIPNL